MSTTVVHAPTSRLKLGHARVDVTPPVGIYHRMWGAARHDRATGVHRPLIADVIALAPHGGGTPLIRVHLDAVGLARPDDTALRAAISEATGVPVAHIQVCCSHTHSGGLLNPDRVALPGGDLIPGHHAATRAKVARVAADALAHARPVTITYGTGTSDMGANRDYRDVGNDLWACGFNPDASADHTVGVLRATDDADGSLVMTAVTYAAHPTSLAWENTLLSPDYPGALRQVVEDATGAPCAFMLAPCGDQGPRDNYVGGSATADANGRQVGYAALAVLEGMGPPATDRAYEGPVVSGATLGVWRHSPHDEARQASTSRFEGATATVDIPRKPGPSAAAWRAEVDRLEGVAAEADARGDTIAARNAAALAERARRWAGRLTHLPEGATDSTYPLPVSVFRIGDVIWATCGGEPYAALSIDLRRRFPGRTILVSPLDGPAEVGYLLTAESYGKGLYQEEPSLPGAGALEVLGGALAGRIAALEANVPTT